MIRHRTCLWRRLAACVVLAILTAAAGQGVAAAASLSEKEVQILVRAIGFLQPPPTGAATIAVAYDASNPASKQDAEAIASYFGEGLKAGGATLTPKLIEVRQLPSGGFVAIIAAAGVRIEQIADAARVLHVACVTGDLNAVESGQCVMTVKSEPKVEIIINRAAAARANVGFGTAFLMMIRQI